MYHLPRESSQIVLRALTHFCYLGVDLFFVLSGFLIGGQVFYSISKNGSFSVTRFFKRRFFRTLPNYYFIIILLYFFGPDNYIDWTYLFFIQNLIEVTGFSQSWSLCIEEHFYLIFPLVVAFFNKKKKLHYFPYFVLASLVAVVITRASLWLNLRPDIIYDKDVPAGFTVYFKTIFYPTFSRFDGVLIGTLVAYVKFFKTDLWARLLDKSNLFFLLFIIIFGATSALSWQRIRMFASMFSFTLYSLSFAFLLIACCKKDFWLGKLKLKGIQTISILSYALYLTHSYAFELGIEAGQFFGYGKTHIITYCLMFTLSFFLAYSLYVFLEQPILKIRDRITN
jgi:peptidoglycan/LPS O-acetylase OafA/YrhL